MLTDKQIKARALLIKYGLSSFIFLVFLMVDFLTGEAGIVFFGVVFGGMFLITPKSLIELTIRKEMEK